MSFETMLTYLIELRRRLLHVVGVFLLLFFVFFYFSSYLMHQWLLPLLHALPDQKIVIATQLTSPILTPIKLAMDAAILCSVPFMLLQIWYFITPALYQRERHSLGYAMFGSLLLFCLGVTFCFYIVLPFMFKFFVQSVPQDVRLMPDIVYVVDFMTRFLILFGLGFQVPIICLLLVYFKLFTVEQLKAFRPYVIVAAFILGMLLTSSDVLSQVMLAIPLWLLYELGIILAIYKKF